MGGSRNYFPVIETYRLAPSLLPETARILREEGRYRSESLVFWAGRLIPPEAEVQTIIVPKGSGVELQPTHVHISAEAMGRVAALIEPPERILLAQVHTHAGAAFHSLVDDVYAFRSPGFVSIVISEYGSGAPMALEAWAVFECLNGAKFRQLPSAEVHQRFRAQPGLQLIVMDADDA